MLKCDLGAATEVAFDGDVTNPSLRRLLTDEEFRQKQGEEDCQLIEQATARTTNAAPETMRDFCVIASEKTPP